jgi:hypothetical protein
MATISVVHRLRALLSNVTYKKGWEFEVADFSECGRLFIRVFTDDSTGQHSSVDNFQQPEDEDYYNFDALRLRPARRTFWVQHVFTIPHESVRIELDRFLLDCIIDVERHEAMEFFKIDGKAPFFPDHTPEGNAYAIVRK